VDAPFSLVSLTSFATSPEKARGIDQINKAILSIDEMTQQNAVLVEETTSSAQSMKE
jgi:methyl-accepting chemotaxis protein